MVSTEGEDLAEPCPVCGHIALHRWFEASPRIPRPDGVERPERGSQWQWCSECRCYEHIPGVVTPWLVAPRPRGEAQRRHDPAPLEVARPHAREKSPD